MLHPMSGSWWALLAALPATLPRVHHAKRSGKHDSRSRRPADTSGVVDVGPLAPTRRKLALTAIGFAVFPALFLLRAIPPQWDLLDLREWSGVLFGFLVGVPIALFDAVTRSAFASTSEGFLHFPSLAQLAAAAVGDALAFYLVACGWVHWRARRVRGRSSDAS